MSAWPFLRGIPVKGTLAPAIDTYLRADAGDETLFDECFAEDAEVRDEGRTIRGVEAIKAWKREAKQKYGYRVDPLDSSQDGDTVRLLARLTGNFPGSPIQLTYTFGLRDGRIASLKIQ